MPRTVIGWRKFGIALAALAMTFVLALMDKVNGTNWVWAVSTIMGLFGISNAAVHISKNGDSS